MKLDFFKMQAQGNDYIYLDLIQNKPPDIEFDQFAVKLSNRHTGIGGDGLVLILPDPAADAFMRIFNADGSEAESCGSALRCVTQYLSQELNKFSIQINSLSGLKLGEVTKDKNIKVNLGKPDLLEKEFQVNKLQGSLVQLGNQHFVIKTATLPSLGDLEKFYGMCQRNKTCKNANLEFYRIIDNHKIEMLVWERGSGATLACGTGAGAATYSGLFSGLLNSPVEVSMPGGNVVIEYLQSDIYLQGQVDFIYRGEIIV